MGFGCECGYAWKGTDACQHEGKYFSDIEREQWFKETAEAIASFVKASASGLRDQWFEGSKYYNSSQHPEVLPDRDVIYDLLLAIQASQGVWVYRCPQCRRVYIQEQRDTNWWLKYQYVEKIGTP